MTSLRHLIRRWRHHSWRYRFQLLRCTLALCVAKLLIVILPIRWVLRLVGTQKTGHPQAMEATVNPRLAALGAALQASARHLPFSATCLVQAVAGALMLRLTGHRPELVLGVQKDDHAGFAAHAWLICDGQIVTGGKGHEDFQVIAKYVDQQNHP